MGTKNIDRTGFPARPISLPFVSSQAMPSFSSIGFAAASEPPSFRPTPPETTVPFSLSGPAVQPGAPCFRPASPRLNYPSEPLPPPPPSSNVPTMPAVGPFQHFPPPSFSSMAQPPLTWAAPMEQQSIQPPANQALPFLSSLPPPANQAPPLLSSLPPQPQMPNVPMESPPIGSNVPPLSQYQPSFHN